ncbi:hypothetical protein [Marinivivus vitaminiproducens]|uniref:hypothetical protein n=1 Tax=Marinivivus vitaminiproducens TaxID=3035935 RepID=UPI0027A75EC8|nr:hypothetical protein P4R82_00050 [Geminicoccaceae bacterium SCSIO 64248]
MESSSPFADIQRLLLAMHPLSPLLNPAGAPSGASGESPVERRIQADMSTAQQIDLLFRAVSALIEHGKLPAAARKDPRIADFVEAHDRIEAIKARARDERLRNVKRAIDDLAAWRKHDAEAFAELRDHVETALGVRLPDGA